MLTRWLYNSCPVCEITSNQRDRLKKSGHLRTFFLWPIPFLKLHSSKSIKSLLTSSTSECSRSPLRLSWLDEGATVPFIARYRKEVTGNLDDTQLRSLEERLLYLRELQERRDVVLASIENRENLRMNHGLPLKLPQPSSYWKTFTFLTSPSAGPARRLPARRGWSRSPMRLFRAPTLEPEREAARYVNDKPAAR